MRVSLNKFDVVTVGEVHKFKIPVKKDSESMAEAKKQVDEWVEEINKVIMSQKNISISGLKEKN